MILVDTSVWIDHFRRTNRRMFDLLEGGEVLCHPFVVGELACGLLTNRAVILQLINKLPMSNVVTHEEVLGFVEHKKLSGTGIGWVDAHLIASSMVTNCAFWSLDKSLARAAARLGLEVQS